MLVPAGPKSSRPLCWEPVQLHLSHRCQLPWRLHPTSLPLKKSCDPRWSFTSRFAAIFNSSWSSFPFWCLVIFSPRFSAVCLLVHVLPTPCPELFLHVCFLSGRRRVSPEAFSNATTCGHEMALVKCRRDGQPCSRQLWLGCLAEPSFTLLTPGPPSPGPELPAGAEHSSPRRLQGRC